MTSYSRARFLTSAADARGLPPDRGREVAFAGRSNAGKSSALNLICHRKGLARTSKTPGRTQLINFFELDAERRLVDLPGYGYAKVPEAVRSRWQQLMGDYFSSRESLVGLILVTDIRRGLGDFDRIMLDLAAERGMPVRMLLTKCDKLRRGPAKSTLLGVRRELGEAVGVQLFSAVDSTGVEEAREVLDGWLPEPEGEV